MAGDPVTRCELGRYAHSCADPLTCALEDLIAGDDPTKAELGRLHEALDRVEDLLTASRARVARDALAVIHAERGGPR